MFKVNISLLVVMMLISSVTLFGSSIFNQAESLEHALKNANSKRKLLLTYAARSSAPCCIAMENATFQNPEVRSLIKSSFYPIKITLADSVGKSWSTLFQIANTPTLLFFDSQGTLIKQVENGLSSNELKSILKEVIFYNKNGFWPIEIDQPVVLTVSVPTQKAALTISDPKIDERLTIKNNQEFKEQNPTNHRFKVLLDHVPTDDPVIKIALERIMLKFPQQLIKVKLLKTDQIPFYQIIIGEFSESSEAQLLLNDLQKEGFANPQLITSP